MTLRWLNPKVADLILSMDYGLQLWLDASNIDGLNNSTLADGSKPLRVWNDLSGNGNNVKQTGLNNPTVSNEFMQFTTVTNHLESDPVNNASFLNITTTLPHLLLSVITIKLSRVIQIHSILIILKPRM